MEIISYVQGEPARFSFPLLIRKRRKQKDIWTFDTEWKTASATRVKNPFSFRKVFVAVGQEVTLLEHFIKKNIKPLLITAISIAIFCTASFFALRFFMYLESHTGPLELAKQTVDFDNLDTLMSAFAMETAPEYDKNGNIYDAVELSSDCYTKPVTYQVYKVKSGDTIIGIARKFGLSNISTLISVNDIGNVRQLAAGQKLRIPSVDGIIYTVKKGDSINSVVDKYGIKLSQLLDVNDLSSDVLSVGQQLFLPGAVMDSQSLKNAMGDMFKLPIAVSFRWTSPYGYRTNPVTGKKNSFHTGTDMACPTGTPILASMSGTVSYTGSSNVWGNYVIINHNNGYQTLYAHMSKIIAKKGQWVSQGTRIGLVGNTGMSTGPHLHFTVYKNGKLIDPMTVLK